MNIITVGCVTLLALTVILYRRAVEERAIRWKLYALRDKLRDSAYRDRGLLGSPVFRRLDAILSGHCGSLIDLSFWALLPLFWMDRDGRLDAEEHQVGFERSLAEPRNAELAKLYEDSVSLITRHLLLRHMFLTFVAAISLIGAVLLYMMTSWVARRVMSGAFQPVTFGASSPSRPAAA